jgi:HSP20 family molecular chaperone IbpA
MTKSQALEVREKKELDAKGERTMPVRTFVPLTDIFESEEALTVVMEVPGVEKKDIDVRVENDVLRIDGKIDPAKYDGLNPLYSEYNVGHFARSFVLSAKVDASRINASVDDGVLTLKLPKIEEARARRIPIG